MLQLFTITTLLASCLGADLHYKDCGSTATLNDVRLDPCPNQPCTIQRGKTYTGTVTFTPSAHSDTANNNCTGFVITETSQLETPFGTCASNQCNKAGFRCPIEAGDQQTYHPTIQAPTDGLVDRRYIAKWFLVGDNNQNIVCFEFPIVFKA